MPSGTTPPPPHLAIMSSPAQRMGGASSPAPPRSSTGIRLSPLHPSEFHVWHVERTPERIDTLRSSRPLLAPLHPVTPGFGFNPNSPARFRGGRMDIYSDERSRRHLWAPPLFIDRSTPAAGKPPPPFLREPPF